MGMWIKRKDREPRKVEYKEYLIASWIVSHWCVQHVYWDTSYGWLIKNDGDSGCGFGDFEYWQDIPKLRPKPKGGR